MGTDWPVVAAAWLLLLCATTLLTAGTLYGDAVALGGLRAAMAAGLLTVLLVAVVGSLDGIAQVIGSVGRESPWRVELPFPPLEGAVNFLGGLGSALQGRPIEFDYWHSTHLLFWPSHLVITEFPFFSFLFADLHAHVIAIPLELTFIALALGLVLGGKDVAPAIRREVAVHLALGETGEAADTRG